VTHEPLHHLLLCEIRIGSSKMLMNVVDRARRLFDLNADPMEIAACLARDPDLRLV